MVVDEDCEILTIVKDYLCSEENNYQKDVQNCKEHHVFEQPKYSPSNSKDWQHQYLQLGFREIVSKINE